MKISSIHAFEILDSRGTPTVKAITTLEDGSYGCASVPSGASTGSYEALELRDKDSKRYFGEGVIKAVNNVNDIIAKELCGMNAEEQVLIDNRMITLDGTNNKSKLGANAILSVSLSVARAASVSKKVPLYQYLETLNPLQTKYSMPIPLMNIINGGKHANWSTDIQEYLIIPTTAASFSHAIQIGKEVICYLKKVLERQNYPTTVGDEGGFAPPVSSNEEPLQLISEAVKKSGHEEKIFFGIDAAASEFYSNQMYHLKKESKFFTKEELSNYYSILMKKYPLKYMEDIFAEDDWEAFQSFNALNHTVLEIVGDDLYATNIKRLQKGIVEKSTNAILIKLNQIGTLTETIDTIILAKKNNITAIISHRSGETEDTFIADLAVAMDTGQIKTGPPCRAERTAKYNRLIEIEKELGDKCTYSKFPSDK